MSNPKELMKRGFKIDLYHPVMGRSVGVWKKKENKGMEKEEREWDCYIWRLALIILQWTFLPVKDLIIYSPEFDLWYFVVFGVDCIPYAVILFWDRASCVWLLENRFMFWDLLMWYPFFNLLLYLFNYYTFCKVPLIRYSSWMYHRHVALFFNLQTSHGPLFMIRKAM